MTYANGHLVVIGGNYKPQGATEFKSIAEVHVAKMRDDGTIEAWKVGGVMPSALNSCTATSDGKRVLVLDGLYDNKAHEGKVWASDVADDGTLAPFTSIGVLPANTRILFSDAWVDGGHLLAMRAKISTEGDAITMVRAPLGETIGAWTQTDWLRGFRGHPQYAYTGSFVYVLGGYEGGTVTMKADVTGAPLTATKDPLTSFATAALPKPTGAGVAMAVDEYIYSFGGKDEMYRGKGSTDVWSTKIATDGTLGAWSTQPAMPAGRSNHCGVVAGDFVWITGGGYDGGGLDNVYSARVRF
jgi:hypothetical protein